MLHVPVGEPYCRISLRKCTRERLNLLNRNYYTKFKSAVVHFQIILFFREMGRRRSGIWQIFTVVDTERGLAECNTCKHRLSYKGTTSNLFRHFIRKHPELQAPEKGLNNEELIYVLSVPDSEECSTSEQDQEPQDQKPINNVNDVGTLIHAPSCNGDDNEDLGEGLNESDPLGDDSKDAPPPKKKLKKVFVPSVSHTIKTEHIPPKRETGDVFEAIGISFAHKLRGMQSEQRIIAEKLISDVMYYGQLGALTRDFSVDIKMTAEDTIK